MGGAAVPGKGKAVRRWSIITLLLILCAPTLSAAPLTADFGERTVKVGGLTPGGTLAWMTVSHDRPGTYLRVLRRDGLVRDEDSDGSVVIDLGDVVVVQSIWALVDLSTGSLTVVTPGAMPLAELAPGSGELLVKPEVREDMVRLAGSRYELMLVRPGAGASVGRFADGTPSDGDGAGDGTLTMPIGALSPLGVATEAVGGYQPGDVLVAINPDSLEYWVKEGR